MGSTSIRCAPGFRCITPRLAGAVSPNVRAGHNPHTPLHADLFGGPTLCSCKPSFSTWRARPRVRSASYLEIYNENIYDLLAPNPKAQALEVKHSGVDGIEVAGLSSRPVTTVEDVVKTIESGNRNRSTFSTNMNEHSSRSHSMLSILVQSVNVHTDQAIRGKIHLVRRRLSGLLRRVCSLGWGAQSWLDIAVVFFGHFFQYAC